MSKRPFPLRPKSALYALWDSILVLEENSIFLNPVYIKMRTRR